MTSPLQRKLKISGPMVVTANRLTDGAVVWLDGSGGWTCSLGTAAAATTAEEVSRLLDMARADESEAVGAYCAPVTLSAEGIPVPANLRERIRASGPTISVPAL